MSPTLSRRRLPHAWPILLCSALLATQALAQPTPNSRRADPLDPNATVPALRYESAMTQYRRLSDEKPVPWREANDAVTRIGGWRAYAREAQQPDPAPAAKPKEAGITIPAKPMPAGHAGHKMP
jgi:hypothetical protein